MSICHFCEAYEAHSRAQQFRRNHPEWYEAKKYFEITVAMVVKSWLPGKKRNCGRITDYRYQGCGYALNYCPECGKLLKKHKKSKEEGE